jgi:aspartate ammonia-lyase
MTNQRADVLFDDSIHTLRHSDGDVREESDSIGSLDIPVEAYWGINTARALENFAISGRPISVYPDLIVGFACVKQAAARANAEIGVLQQDKAYLIDSACEEIKEGKLHDQFVVDIIQGGVGVFLELSGALKGTAMKLSKICNDLWLLCSGPQAGFNEINLPARQAGSRIMPGKVNPVIPEVVNEVAFAVAGHDVTITMAAEAGQLQLNAFLPVIAHTLFESLKWMTAAIATLRTNCVEGITANTQRLAAQVGSFVGVITALIPHIGYGPASELARETLATNADITDLVVKSGILKRDQVTAMLSPENLTSNRAHTHRTRRE